MLWGSPAGRELGQKLLRKVGEKLRMQWKSWAGKMLQYLDSELSRVSTLSGEVLVIIAQLPIMFAWKSLSLKLSVCQ